MSRRTRNVVAAAVVFLALLLLPVLFAGCTESLPTSVVYECPITSASGDTTVSVGDTILVSCTKQ